VDEIRQLVTLYSEISYDICTQIIPHFLKIRFVSVLFFTCMIFQAQAQSEFKSLCDTFLCAVKKKPSLTGYLDGRRSFVNSFPANVFGIFGGVNYGKRLDVGLAYYTTAFSTPYDVTINKGTAFEYKALRKITFEYLAIKADYTFYKTKHWEFSVPISIGRGNGHIYNYHTDTNKLYNYTDLKVMPLEMGVTGIYLFYDWIGLSSGLSYRLNLTNWQYFNEFTALSYTAGVSVRFGTLWRHVKKGPTHWYKGFRGACCLF